MNMLREMKISKEMRGWLVGPMIMLWTGIYLTGFDRVSLLLYLPAFLSIFASATGICPGIMLIRRALAKKEL